MQMTSRPPTRLSLSPKDLSVPADTPWVELDSASGGLEFVELIEPSELVEVKLSFLATRGEEEPPVLDGIVTSGGAVVDETEYVEEEEFLGEEREIETTLSP